MAPLAYIDDSVNNLECISQILKSDFKVNTFEDPYEFLNHDLFTEFKAILLDIHMPNLDGFALCEKILEHSDYNGCPIIFISVDDTDLSRIKSYSLGAVDFMNRRTSPDEMLTRVKSKINFHEKHKCDIVFGALKLDLTILKATMDSKDLKLTFTEFKLLLQMIKSYKTHVKKEELIQKVWGNENILDATLYTHVFNLNEKLLAWDHEIIFERSTCIQLLKKKRDL